MWRDKEQDRNQYWSGRHLSTTHYEANGWRSHWLTESKRKNDRSPKKEMIQHGWKLTGRRMDGRVTWSEDIRKHNKHINYRNENKDKLTY